MVKAMCKVLNDNRYRHHCEKGIASGECKNASLSKEISETVTKKHLAMAEAR